MLQHALRAIVPTTHLPMLVPFFIGVVLPSRRLHLQRTHLPRCGTASCGTERIRFKSALLRDLRRVLLQRASPTMAPSPRPQDFIKGWPHNELLQSSQLREGLLESFKHGLAMSEQSLNYGDIDNGAYMLGHPAFRKALADFLSKQYNAPVDPKTLMTTAGCSMGVDIACRMHCSVGDIAIVEEPTYYLSFTMIRDRGMSLMGVGMEDDGIDIAAVEKILKENPGKACVCLQA